MTSRVFVLVFGAAFLALAGWAGANAAREKAPAEGEKPGSSPQQPLSLSLLQLIATPDAFEGKYVRVHGFVRIEHEGTAVYLHREDSEHMLTKNGLWLAASDTAAGPDFSSVTGASSHASSKFLLRTGRHHQVVQPGPARVERGPRW